MKIIEIRIKLNPTKEIGIPELNNLAEFIKDRIYDLNDPVIEDVTYEVRDDYQE